MKRPLSKSVHALFGGLLLTVAGSANATDFSSTVSAGDHRPARDLPGPKPHPEKRLTKVDRNSIIATAPQNDAFSKTQPTSPARIPMLPGQANLMGIVLWSSGYVNEGMARIPQNESHSFVEFNRDLYCTTGAIRQGDTYYLVQYTDSPSPQWRLDTYDPISFELLSRDWDNTGDKYSRLCANALALDPADGKVYGCFYSTTMDSFEFGYADFSTLSRTTICPIEDWWHACGIDSKGRLFALNGDGLLYQVDKSTGDMTLIGDTGVVTEYTAGGALDAETDKFYVTTSTGNGAFIYSIDLETASATQLLQFPANEEVAFLYVDEPIAPQGAPQAPFDLTVDFSQGTEGTVSFTTPDHLYNGQDVEGDVEYIISANGVTLKEGSTIYGTSVTTEVSLPSDGHFKISVRLSNDAGLSPAASAAVSVGNSSPLMGNVTLSYDKTTMKLTWPEATAEDPYAFFDPTQVTYTVVRHSDGKVVAETLTETIYEEEYTYEGELKQESYEVTAFHIDKQSNPRHSNTVFAGYIVPPFKEDFEEKINFNMFSIIDGNNDGKVWEYNNNAARMPFNVYAQMDDWLVTPPIKLGKGRYYKFALDARCEKSSFPERFEVFWGTEPTIENLNKELIPSTDVNYDTYRNHYGYIVPESDGLYYVGIHGISDKDEYYLYIDNIVLEDGLPQTAPGLVTELNVRPNYDGEGEATLTFTAPDKDLSGNSLASLDRIEVLRGDSLVLTVSPVTTGQVYTVTDTDVPSGVTTYYVYGVNADGSGVPVKCETRVGIPVPTAPTNLIITEPTPGYVTATWTAPETDTYGNPLNPKFVTYSVSNLSDGTLWVTDVADTTTSFTVSTSEQAMYNFTVTAMTETGSAKTSTLLTPVGEPYDLPYAESFADGKVNYTLGTYGEGGQWELYTDNNDMTCADGDNGFIAMRGPVVGSFQMLWTGKISLERAVSPKISLQVFNFYSETENDNSNIIELQVKEFGNEATDYETISSTRVCDLGEAGWNSFSSDLSDYCGKVVSVRFKVITVSHVYTFIDDIRIFDNLTTNLTALSMSAPSEVKPGQEFEVKVNILNSGSETAETWMASLTADGFAPITANGKSLAPGEACTITFPVTLNASSRSENSLSAVVYLEGDENELDDILTSDVNVITPALQTPYGLTAEFDNETVILSWTEPDHSEIIREETESFEFADAWSDQVEGWTFIDNDEGYAGGFKQVDIPCLPAGTQGAFWVMDSEFEGFNLTFRSHSGTHYLGGMYNITGEPNDDWAISPELEGGAQNISFHARSYTNAETIQILYSTGSIDTSDFIALTDSIAVPNEWTCFEAELPDGANRFAVRSVGSSNLMLMMDDFTFTPRPAMRDAELIGYNVYRDGIKINDDPISETDYQETLTGSSAEYSITAVYTIGESGSSEHVAVNATTAIEGVVNNLSIYVVNQTIYVKGADGRNVSVSTIDGKTIFNAVSKGQDTVTVSPGLYIVTVDKNSSKIIVR